MEISRSTSVSRILWSIPSYRPQRRIRSRFFEASFSVFGWVRVSPCGVRNITGPLLVFWTCLIASWSGWGVITIPAPPPNGISSTFLCLSLLNLRMS